MRALQFDSVGGASGDMILAALIDLGVDCSDLQKKLECLAVESFHIRAEKITLDGLRGTQVHVDIPGDAADHRHRTFPDISLIITDSALPDPVKDLAVKVFARLAEAEAAVHGTTPGEVQFHEVGAVDSVVDIVGACLGLHVLGVDEVMVGVLPLGNGVAESLHGIIPVPAPATVELLKGHPVKRTQEPYELVTPTGAALLTTWRQVMGGVAGGEARVVGTGYAFGHRKLEHGSNMLRACLLENAESGGAGRDRCVVLECDLDDTSPELVGALAQRLLGTDALDVFTTPIQMKKQRPGMLLTVLCRPERRDACIDLIFRESTTFGIREHMTERTVLERRHIEVETPYGTVRVKVGTWKGEDITRAPEYDDCAARAAEQDVPLRTVYEAALRG